MLSDCCVSPEAKYLSATVSRISAGIHSQRQVVSFTIAGTINFERLSNDSGDIQWYPEREKCFLKWVLYNYDIKTD